VCGQQTRPAAQPPAGSGPVVLFIAPCFEAQGNQSVVEAATYTYYIQVKPSAPSRGVWVPYDDSTEKMIVDDFHRLWNTNFLDNLWIETADYAFPNGVVGKIVTYNMEERQRVKIVDYVGSKKVETAKIYEKLKEANAEIRLDTFIDPALVRKVEGIVRDMLREKGFQFADVTHEIADMPGGPKLIHLTVPPRGGAERQDPARRVRRQLGDRRRQAEAADEGKQGARALGSDPFPDRVHRMIAGRGTYSEPKFDEDAEKVVAYYRDHGYLRANVGVPDLKVIRGFRRQENAVGRTAHPDHRGAALQGRHLRRRRQHRRQDRIPEAAVQAEVGRLLRREADSQRPREGARDVRHRRLLRVHRIPRLQVPRRPQPERARGARGAQGGLNAKEPPGPPVVDVTMRMQEGQQFFVNRITFTGNTTTRDNVIRREMRLVEGGVFNTEALKYSVKRLNQLGYFKALEGKPGEVDVQKTPNATNKIDVKLKLEEQNRNSLTFGAGVSEFEGFFGQLSFQTANFLGRGESLTLSLQAGSRAQNYSLAFTEPFLFDRNITGGFNIFRTDIRYIGQFTQRSAGAVATLGVPLGRGFTRLFANYSYERVRVTEINEVYTDPIVLARNPFLRDSLLLGQGGERIISKVVPSLVYNSVDQPIFPTSGKRFSASMDLAGLGGNTNFYKPMLEGVYYWRQGTRLTLGMRGQFEYIHQFSGSKELPIFEKLFLGGEYSIRGFDIRTVGPQDPQTGLVLGGNKSLLFNIEEQFTIAGPVRLIAFYDAGQVQPGPTIQGPPAFVPEGGSLASTLVTGKDFSWNDFKTSTGLEVRFFMPVLNVPFRLIFAYNPQRAGVLDNSLHPQKAFQFRFAVGSTF
jgi:outer membrane protein insertion porin family